MGLPFFYIFSFATHREWALYAIGTVAAIVSGMAFPMYPQCVAAGSSSDLRPLGWTSSMDTGYVGAMLAPPAPLPAERTFPEAQAVPNPDGHHITSVARWTALTCLGLGIAQALACFAFLSTCTPLALSAKSVLKSNSY